MDVFVKTSLSLTHSLSLSLSISLSLFPSLLFYIYINFLFVENNTNKINNSLSQFPFPYSLEITQEIYLIFPQKISKKLEKPDEYFIFKI